MVRQETSKAISALQADCIFAVVPNLRKDSANVSNGADGVLVIIVFHGW